MKLELDSFQQISAKPSRIYSINITLRFPTRTVYGWLTRSEATNKFTKTLFQESAFNQHIHFIEWDDRFNCVIEDGIYISQEHFWMSKEEVLNLMARMEPALEARSQ